MDTTKRQLSVVRCPLSVAGDDRDHGPRTTDYGLRTAFTLVELLVVITIIGILAALITVAAVAALKSSRRTEIKAEINQIDGGFNELKNKTNAFPPNCQTDDTSGPISEATALADLKRYMKIAFPRHQESDVLLARLVGIDYNTGKSIGAGKPLAGGLSAGEAVVFWLGGFSSDPKYPISGAGGPAYPISGFSQPTNYTLDPIESRKWVFPFHVDRLVPRGSDGYFDSASTRYFEYSLNADGTGQKYRINLWQYTPRKLDQPYLYFDTSRYAPSNATDPPAATALSGLSGNTTDPMYVYAFKKQNPTWSSTNTSVPALSYINPDKFQIIHCGINDRWADEFKKMSCALVNTNNPNDYMLYPNGPFTGDISEAIVNFTTETKIEDAQK